MMAVVLMHQGVGLAAFNSLPTRRAVHALYECVNSVTMAADLAKGRPFADHAALFRMADALLFSLPEESVDQIMTAHPRVGRRPGSTYSHSEQCSLFDPRPGVMHLMAGAAARYAEKFGFEFVMHVGAAGADCSASAVISAIGDRMHNDTETERKVVRNEIAKLNRSRLERMLGPEGGYDNWV
jgi:OHCU decarboxylase